MGGICTKMKDELDIEKQAKAFSSAIRDAEQNRRYQQCLHEKEQARLEKRAATDREAKRALRADREMGARDALISDFEDPPKSGRRTSRDHSDTKSRRQSGDVSSRKHSHAHDYDSSDASKKATARYDDNDDGFGRAPSGARSHRPRRASVGFDGDHGTEDFSSRRNGFAIAEDCQRRHSDDLDHHHKHHHNHHTHKDKDPKTVVTASTTKGTVISHRRGPPQGRLRRSSTASLEGENSIEGLAGEHDKKLVRKASSFTLKGTGNNTNDLLGALGMDVSFRRNAVQKKVNGKELAWLGQMDTMFDNDRDPKKSEHMKQLDREIHKATAGFFNSM